jgi:hypothetical protein
MTANQKYQKERAKEQADRVKIAVKWAEVCFRYPNSAAMRMYPDRQHKRLQLI